jgi:hypothetical protein
MRGQTITLRDVLTDIDAYPTKAWLYLPASKNWKLESPGLVLESDEVPPHREDEPDSGVPDLARRLGMIQALPIADVQDIVWNVRRQRPHIDDQTLLKAFLYYYENDGYISF